MKRKIIAFLIDLSAIGGVSALTFAATQSYLWMFGSQIVIGCYSVWCYYDGSTR